MCLPFYDLLKKPVSTSSQVPWSSKALTVNKDPSQLQSSTPISWQNYHQGALKILIHTVTSSPLLCYVDVSTKGHERSLYHQIQGKIHVLGCESRGLLKTEKWYQSSKLEFSTRKWGNTLQTRQKSSICWCTQLLPRQRISIHLWSRKLKYQRNIWRDPNKVGKWRGLVRCN